MKTLREKYEGLEQYAACWNLNTCDESGRVSNTKYKIYYANSRFVFDISNDDGGGSVIMPEGDDYRSFSRLNDESILIERDKLVASLVGVTSLFALWMPGWMLSVPHENPATNITESESTDGCLGQVTYKMGDVKVTCTADYQIIKKIL